MVCLFADAWIAAEFLKMVPHDLPICGYVPCDGYNMRHASVLNRYAMTAFLSPFAEKEARAAGFVGASMIVGHGVDLELYRPYFPFEAREMLGLPTHGALIGAVGQNQVRKHYDIILYAFRLLLERTTRETWLYCHCRPQDIGYDVEQLASYLGIADRVVFPTKPMTPTYPESEMPLVYSALDVQCSATWGEGFGLTTLEGMACGVPQIVPYHTALADWTDDAAYYLTDLHPEVTIGGVNIVGMAPRAEELATALELTIAHTPTRLRLQEAGLALAAQPQFRWEACAAQMHMALCKGMAIGAPS
jgi:glycosyltransferase involved in cell wall biosynthesis